MWIASSVEAAETSMCPHYSPDMDHLCREFRQHSPGIDGLRVGSGESAEFPTSIKEVGSWPVLVKWRAPEPLRGKWRDFPSVTAQFSLLSCGPGNGATLQTTPFHQIWPGARRSWSYLGPTSSDKVAHFSFS